MKKNNYLYKIVGLTVTILFSTTLLAQKDMVQFLAAGKEDANKFADYYAKPFLNTFGNNMNNGWYSTAEPLKTGRFTITLGATASFIPSDEQSFSIDPSEYTTISTPGNLPVNSPTMFGDIAAPSNVSARYNNGSSNITFPLNLPEGSGSKMSPLPVIQLSVGLIKNTEVMLRIFPKINVSGYKVGYFGIGLKHDIKQWIPFMSKLPIDLSFIGSYTNASLDIIGGDFLLPQEGVSNPNAMDYTSQQLNFSSNAWNTNLVISKKFSVLTVFGGFRLSGSKTKVDLMGYYPFTILSNPINPTSKVISHVIDPIHLEGSGTQFGINAGVRVKLAFIALFAEGSLVPGGYSSVTAGLNFGFFN